MLLQEYDIIFIHLKGKDNILTDAISRLCTINIYEDHAEVKLQHPTNPQNKVKSSKVTENMQLLDTGTAQCLLNITTKTLKSLQKQDRFCKRKVHKLKTGMQYKFYLNNENIFKKEINGK